MRKALIASLLICLALASVQSGSSQHTNRAESRPLLKAATLERAPGALGALRSTSGSLVIATAAKGKEVVVADGGSGEVASYLETGAAWGKPVHLQGRQGDTFSVVFRFKVDGNVLAFAAPGGIAFFRRDTGEMLAESADFHHAADIAEMPGGDWVINLVWLPIPELVRVAREKFNDTEPRLVVVNGKLEVFRHGLTAESGRTGNETAARRLRLAASPDRLYAAELANYKIYEFDRQLRLRATYVDPSLQLEKGLDLPPQAGVRKRFAEEAQRQVDQAGTDASKGSAHPPAKFVSEKFSYQPAIYDMGWDVRSNRLILLLAPGVAGDGAALDLLDPATGQVQRLMLRLPPDVASYGPLAQLAIGYRNLWLRNNLGANPTLRLDRSALEDAQTVKATTMR